MEKRKKEDFKRERVWILTERNLIEGTLFQPQDIRLSDAVNAPAAHRDRPYMALTDAVVTRVETGQELFSTRFLLVSRGQIVVMMPKSEVLAGPAGKRPEPLLKNGPAQANEALPGRKPHLRPNSSAAPASSPTGETGWATVETGPPPATLSEPTPSSGSWTSIPSRAEVDDLVRTLRQKSSASRLQALVELERLGPEARSAVPALIEALADKNSTIREWAAVTLAKIGGEAVAAQPALILALEDKVEAVRRRAVMALRRMDPEAKAPLDLLLGLTKDRDEFVREWAVMALGCLGPEAKPGVAALIDALDDEVDFVRRVAADALGKIGPEAAEAIPILTNTLKDKDVLARYWAAEALKRINPNGHGNGKA